MVTISISFPQRSARIRNETQQAAKNHIEEWLQRTLAYGIPDQPIRLSDAEISAFITLGAPLVPNRRYCCCFLAEGNPHSHIVMHILRGRPATVRVQRILLSKIRNQASDVSA